MKHSLNAIQKRWIDENPYDFSGLSALFLNCTLKKSPEKSHTEALMNLSKEIMDSVGVKTEILRPVDYDVAIGVYPDMREHGWEKDDWPSIQKKVMDANILIIGTPIWLGEKSSVATLVIERLYGFSGYKNNKGQYSYYGRTGGCIITGNEDGVKHCSMSLLYGLQHIGYTIPPQADAGWIGEVGPGKSYADENSGGPENDFTNRNTTFMTWNLLHTAKMLADNNGLPAHGNQRSLWE
ncbi:MAG: NAD(P)H-dependent oxidoreductase [Balneolaceae bacterium]